MKVTIKFKVTGTDRRTGHKVTVPLCADFDAHDLPPAIALLSCPTAEDLQVRFENHTSEDTRSALVEKYVDSQKGKEVE
jgi:hypothetical protein